MRALPVLGLLLFTLALGGCQQAARREILPIPAVAVAVAAFNQPTATTDLLAGALPEARHLAPQTDLDELDLLLRSQLELGARPYFFLPPQDYLRPLQRDERGKRSSLATWIRHAREAGAPLILVPQVLQWPDGQKNRTVLDFFLIDAREDGRLLQRLKFEYENQAGPDLLGLIQADLEQIIEEFGL